MIFELLKFLVVFKYPVDFSSSHTLKRPDIWFMYAQNFFCLFGLT